MLLKMNRLLGSIAAAALFSASGAFAQDFCITGQNNTGDADWRIDIVTGDDNEFPIEVVCPNNEAPVCKEYAWDITTLERGKVPDHFIVLSSDDHEIVGTKIDGTDTNANSVKFFDPCEGDDTTNIGEHDCHDVATRFNKKSDTFRASLTIAGNSSAVKKTVAVKGGRHLGACGILGPGAFTLSPFQTVTTTRFFKRGGCTLEVEFSSTGEPIVATVTGQGCQIVRQGGSPFLDMSLLEVLIGLDECPDNEDPPCNVGLGRFGLGEFTAGNNTCTIIPFGQTFLMFGSPCP